MRLTQIKLAGFKSFVDPTAIHVPGQLVGIVGPNGCGKSNVIDAVRWVLGESRASALRGESMQDVIFNGAGSRSPLGRASVELIFDNALGRVSGPWSEYGEIAVKRILQRDGESSYYINGQHVRRRDITDIFLGTGLGPRAYAIIEQGMISRVIEAKPDELRVFLEEAAGISKYKERRRETEHRLSDTRENLSRVTDIRLELGGQIEKLESQAQIAGRYTALQTDMQFKQHLLWFQRRRDAGAERERHAQETERCEQAVEAETATLRAVEARVEAARETHYRTGDGLNAAQATLYTANAEVARLESDLRHVEDTRGRLENQHTERRAQLSAWREQRAQLTQALHMWAVRAGEAQSGLTQVRATQEAEAARLPDAETAFRQTQERHGDARNALMRAESTLQLEQTNLAHLDRGLAALEQRGERLDGELGALEAPDAAAIETIETGIRSVAEALTAAEATVNAVQAECTGGEAAHAEALETLDLAVHAATTAEAQLATLKQIQAATEDNAPLQEWLARHQLEALPRLWQKLRIDAGWETAVEAILRERLHALELGDWAELDAMLADQPPVKANTYVPLAPPGMANLPPSAQASLAARVHSAEPALAGAIEDWFAGVQTCEGTPAQSERSALAPGAILVNRAGHQFTRYTVSLHAPDPVDAGILSRQVEIDALTPRCARCQGAVAAARLNVDAAEAFLAGRREALDAARVALAGHQRARHDAEIELLKRTQARQRHAERSAQIEAERQDIGAEQTRESERRSELEARSGRITVEIEAARAALEAIKTAHLAAEVSLTNQRQTLQQAERAVQDAVFAARECESKISEIDTSVRVIDQQITRAEAEIAKLTEELADDPVPALRETLDAAVEVRLACEKTLAGARNAVEEAAAALRSLEEQRLQSEGRLTPLRDRIGELRLKEQAARLSFEQFATQLAEVSADEERLAQAVADAPRPTTLQTEINRLSQSIQELGAVNLAALEELSSSRERKGFLDAQSADLEEAVATLEDAIRKIDRETRELLRDTFESVNRHFGTLFPALFGGGEARLSITGDEILDAGVQVMAHPPGKRNSTIHLLSGGEKALTAIALVFSLFQLNPAPFCLLDEVDAPLDDSNTLRFVDLVRRMSVQTQFLFISHNKLTMEMAEQLIGVTMPESGVSRVVAVDIDEALRIREELAA